MCCLDCWQDICGSRLQFHKWFSTTYSWRNKSLECSTSEFAMGSSTTQPVLGLLPLDARVCWRTGRSAGYFLIIRQSSDKTYGFCWVILYGTMHFANPESCVSSMFSWQVLTHWGNHREEPRKDQGLFCRAWCGKNSCPYTASISLHCQKLFSAAFLDKHHNANIKIKWHQIYQSQRSWISLSGAYTN